MSKKKYPAPVGNGLEIVAMMRFKQPTSMEIVAEEVWQYDEKSKGFFCRELPYRCEIFADESEYFPVYHIEQKSVQIFMWESSTGLGIFVPVRKDLIGKLLTRVERIPFSKIERKLWEKQKEKLKFKTFIVL